jgi:hypothetical protein
VQFAQIFFVYSFNFLNSHNHILKHWSYYAYTMMNILLVSKLGVMTRKYTTLDMMTRNYFASQRRRQILPNRGSMLICGNVPKQVN